MKTRLENSDPFPKSFSIIEKVLQVYSDWVMEYVIYVNVVNRPSSKRNFNNNKMPVNPL